MQGIAGAEPAAVVAEAVAKTRRHAHQDPGVQVVHPEAGLRRVCQHFTRNFPPKLTGDLSSTGPRGPTGSRQPSYTNLKREKKEKEQSGAAGGMAKEKSFVEKGFVETMKQPIVEVRGGAP